MMTSRTSARPIGLPGLGHHSAALQSGKVGYNGHISRRGDGRLHAVLYEAASVLLTRVRRESAFRRWGLMFMEAVRLQLARKMAVVLHAMWKSGTPFKPTLGAVTP